MTLANPESRQIRLLRDDHVQALHIPPEFELPGTEAIITRDGNRLIIEPVQKMGLAALLDSWGPLDDDIPEIDDPPLPPKDIF